jgi:aminoglycoside phosphotransferase (APT) family kinase protein
MARDTDRLAAGLRTYLPRGAGITGVITLSAGHSNETYLVDGIGEVLRMPPSEEGLLPPYDMARQHAVLSAVAGAAPGVPLPPVLELCTNPSVIGDEFFLMGQVKGDAFEYAVPDWLAADPQAGAESVCRQWFDALIALHNMPVSAMPPGERTVQQEAQHWLDVARGAESAPVLVDILEDLAKRPPRTSGAPTPVHGDPKHGNCLWDEGRLTALLDWEMAQISEPLLDLGYVLMFHDQGEASLVDILEDLAKRPPRTSGAPTPVHGDPKHGNCLWDEGRLTALLDWEMAQISEPLLDLGYVLMFHDQGEASLADAGFDLPGWWSPERMVAEWEEGTGRTAVDVARYAVLGQAKVAAIISVGAFLFNSGRIADPRFQAFAGVLPAYVALLEKRAMAAG